MKRVILGLISWQFKKKKKDISWQAFQSCLPPIYTIPKETNFPKEKFSESLFKSVITKKKKKCYKLDLGEIQNIYRGISPQIPPSPIPEKSSLGFWDVLADLCYTHKYINEHTKILFKYIHCCTTSFTQQCHVHPFTSVQTGSLQT